jgi:hypothetical protein
MRSYIIRRVLAVVTLITTPHITLAQSSAQPASAAKAQTPGRTPDFSGVWIKKRGQIRNFTDNMPEMQPSAQEYCDRIGCGKGEQVSALDATADPVIWRCAPAGFPRMMLAVEPFEIFQVQGRVIFRFEQWFNAVRQIWTDGRGHPKDVGGLWMGDSIGTWDGDTLVVDTIGMNDHTWLDLGGRPYSESLHVVERIRRVDQHTLQDDLTFEDPKAYKKTFTGKVVYELRPKIDIMEAVLCEDRILADDPLDAFPFTKETPRTVDHPMIQTK